MEEIENRNRKSCRTKKRKRKPPAQLGQPEAKRPSRAGNPKRYPGPMPSLTDSGPHPSDVSSSSSRFFLRRSPAVTRLPDLIPINRDHQEIPGWHLYKALVFLHCNPSFPLPNRRQAEEIARRRSACTSQ
jgi:hypothetical protein